MVDSLVSSDGIFLFSSFTLLSSLVRLYCSVLMFESLASIIPCAFLEMKHQYNYCYICPYF